MDFETFIRLVLEALEWRTEKDLHQKGLSEYWTIGGESYSWECVKVGDKSAEPEPPFEDLDKVLAHIVPDLPAMALRRLDSLVERSTETDRYDYYGSYEEKGVKRIGIRELYTFLTPYLEQRGKRLSDIEACHAFLDAQGIDGGDTLLERLKSVEWS